MTVLHQNGYGDGAVGFGDGDGAGGGYTRDKGDGDGRSRHTVRVNGDLYGGGVGSGTSRNAKHFPAISHDFATTVYLTQLRPLAELRL